MFSKSDSFFANANITVSKQGAFVGQVQLSAGEVLANITANTGALLSIDATTYPNQGLGKTVTLNGTAALTLSNDRLEPSSCTTTPTLPAGTPALRKACVTAAGIASRACAEPAMAKLARRAETARLSH